MKASELAAHCGSTGGGYTEADREDCGRSCMFFRNPTCFVFLQAMGRCHTATKSCSERQCSSLQQRKGLENNGKVPGHTKTAGLEKEQQNGYTGLEMMQRR